ncbi:MAG: NAD-dependent epimerase/dehydratase family protein [Patescibacteria group bacterium]
MLNTKTIFNRKNILVTGGAGFIGSHVCDELVKQSNVICIDDFSTSHVENINHLLENPNFEFIKHDLTKRIDLTEQHELDKFKIRFQGIQEIYHLACPTSPKNFNKQRYHSLLTNGVGTINVLELAKAYKAKFLLASSSVVYGPRFPNAPRFTEDYHGYVDCNSPRACYDEGKRFAESSAITYRDMFSLDIKIARIFRTYGPRMSLFDGHMVPDFVLQALNSKPMVIYGDETFSTSLCYVSDVVEGLLKLMNSKEYGPLNFGHYDEIKMTDIANKIKTMVSSSSEVSFAKPMLFMSPLGLPDLTAVKEKLGWYPLVPLDEGLQKTIEYIKANQFILQPMLWKYEDEESQTK